MSDNLDKMKVQGIIAALKKSLAQVGDEYSVVITLGTMRFDATRASVKIDLAPKMTIGGVTQTPAQIKARADMRYAREVGGWAEWLDLVVTFRGVQYRIVGCTPNKPKNAFQLQRLDNGAGVQCSLEMLQAKANAALAAQKVINNAKQD